jgi:hypothetical protein
VRHGQICVCGDIKLSEIGSLGERCRVASSIERTDNHWEKESWQTTGPRMIDEIAVRDARSDESGYIMKMTRLMVCEMEKFGGRQATKDESAWSDRHQA